MKLANIDNETDHRGRQWTLTEWLTQVCKSRCICIQRHAAIILSSKLSWSIWLTNNVINKFKSSITHKSSEIQALRRINTIRLSQNRYIKLILYCIYEVLGFSWGHTLWSQGACWYALENPLPQGPCRCGRVSSSWTSSPPPGEDIFPHPGFLIPRL